MTLLDAPKWKIGNENSFLDFVKGVDSNIRVALLSHTDQDGIAAARVANEYFSTDLVFFADYADLNELLVQKLRATGATLVVITDLMIKKKEFIIALEEFAHVLIIDHHQVDCDFTSARTIFMNAQGFCAAYLAYYLFSAIKSLEHVDWIVACASISDWAYSMNSRWMTGVFQKYGEHFTADSREIKKGVFWETQAAISLSLVYFKDDIHRVYRSVGTSFRDVGDLQNYSSIIQQEIDRCIVCFEKEKKVIDGGYFWEFSSQFPVKSIVSTVISAGMPETTILIAERRGDMYNLSGRRQDKKVSMNDLLKRLTQGFEPHDAGGHIPAAGGFIMMKDVPEFKKRLSVA